MGEAEDVASRGAGGAGGAAGRMEALLLKRWLDDWAAECDVAAALSLWRRRRRRCGKLSSGRLRIGGRRPSPLRWLRNLDIWRRPAGLESQSGECVLSVPHL